MRRAHVPGAALLLSAASAVLAEEHNVTVNDNFFSPQHITITAGDTVRWTNDGSNAHNVVADDGSFRCAEGCDDMSGGGGVNSYHEPGGQPGDPSSDGWSFSLQFDEPGEIGYHCEVHGSSGLGMYGTITVEGAEEENFDINFGLTGSWFNPATSGQGFLFDVVPSQMQVVIYWFTFDDEAGGPEGQRWMIAQGDFVEGQNTIAMEVLQVTGGVFDDPEAVTVTTIGSAELEFEDCTNASMTYDLDFDGDEENNLTGIIPIGRLSPDVMCEPLADEDDES